MKKLNIFIKYCLDRYKNIIILAVNDRQIKDERVHCLKTMGCGVQTSQKHEHIVVNCMSMLFISFDHDPESSREFYNTFGRLRDGMVKHIQQKYGADIDDAHDATQETLLILFRMWKDKSLETVNDPKAYAFRILRNQYLRILKKRSSFIHDEIERYISESERSHFDELIEQEYLNTLKSCVSMLSQRHQEFFNYWYKTEGATPLGFAEKYGVSVKCAWTAKHRIKQILRDCVKRKIDGTVNQVYLNKSLIGR